MRNTLALILTTISLAASTASVCAQKDSISFDLGINTFRLWEWKRSSVLDPDVWNPDVISANINAKKIAFRL
ncbi:MAG: hypothetical protein ACKO6L_01185, partial [Flavobacteriales bacterium]